MIRVTPPCTGYPQHVVASVPGSVRTRPTTWPGRPRVVATAPGCAAGPPHPRTAPASSPPIRWRWISAKPTTGGMLATMAAAAIEPQAV
jgi:hypothetical protein